MDRLQITLCHPEAPLQQQVAGTGLARHWGHSSNKNSENNNKNNFALMGCMKLSFYCLGEIDSKQNKQVT